MKRVLLTACALALVGLASGCATVQVAQHFDGVVVDGGAKPIATVAAENYGYYLFGTFPVISGTPGRPNANACQLFDETVTVQNNLAMVSNAVKLGPGRKLANVKTTEEWTGSFSLWILWRRTIFTSALVVE